MGQNAHTGRSPRGVVTIDWMVMAVAAIALLFLIGTMIRTSVKVDPAADGGGLPSLSPGDTLLAYQDFSFDAGIWSPSSVSDDLPGLGPVLGPFGTEPVQRSFTIPANTGAVVINFDVHLIGGWSDAARLRMAIGQAEAVVLSAAGTNPVAVEVSEIDGLRVHVSQSTITPRAPKSALGGEVNSFAAVRIQLTLDNPPETIALRLQAEAEGEARWTLDNLSVVASDADSRP